MRTALVVILQAKVSDELLSLEMAQRVLQLHELDEQVVLGIEPWRRHRRLEVEAQPLLDAETAQFRGALREVEEEDEVEHDRCGEYGIAAEKVELDLHGIPEPSEDVDVVPTFFVI